MFAKYLIYRAAYDAPQALNPPTIRPFRPMGLRALSGQFRFSGLGRVRIGFGLMSMHCEWPQAGFRGLMASRKNRRPLAS
jgi:hypothetical protein